MRVVSTSLRSSRTLREERAPLWTPADRWRDACDGVQTMPEAVALCPQDGRRHGRVVVHCLFSLHLRGLRLAVYFGLTCVRVSHVPVVREDGGCGVVTLMAARGTCGAGNPQPRRSFLPPCGRAPVL